jgi:hypothetical protein
MLNAEDELNDMSDPTFRWFYYDEEEEFEKLLEGCNIKGIRERKLQENLRKIKDRIKLKKSKKSQAIKEGASGNQEIK